VTIRKWFVFSTLKNAFGSSTDSTLTRLRDLLNCCNSTTPFPAAPLYESLGVEPSLTEVEIARILEYGYQERYTNLGLSLLYPDRDWKNAVFHEDHVFPQTEFQTSKLKKRGYDDAKVYRYLNSYNSLANLQLLTDSENLSKNATPFDEWLKTRDPEFRKRHRIPQLPTYEFDSFEEFLKGRKELITEVLKQL
jgi:hypothetical protein